MQIHNYKIVLADNSVLSFKSKQTVESIYILQVDNRRMLCFDGGNFMVDRNEIKKITVDRIEIKVARYKVH